MQPVAEFRSPKIHQEGAAKVGFISQSLIREMRMPGP